MQHGLDQLQNSVNVHHQVRVMVEVVALLNTRRLPGVVVVDVPASRDGWTAHGVGADDSKSHYH